MEKLDHKCKKCGLCCKNEEIGPIVTPEEVKIISRHIEEDYFDFLNQNCKKSYIVVDGKKYEIYFLNKIESGCVFLTKDNLCSIYSVRPYQCRNTPFDFLSQYKYWKHMKCVNFEEFENIDSTKQDKMFLCKILEGYGG